MPFMPTAINDQDSQQSRTYAAINVGRDLRGVFNKSGLTVLTSPSGDVFGVTDFESHDPVGNDVVDAVQKGLLAWGYDSKVVALPGAKGATSLDWSELHNFRMNYKLSL